MRIGEGSMSEELAKSGGSIKEAPLWSAEEMAEEGRTVDPATLKEIQSGNTNLRDQDLRAQPKVEVHFDGDPMATQFNKVPDARRAGPPPLPQSEIMGMDEVGERIQKQETARKQQEVLRQEKADKERRIAEVQAQIALLRTADTKQTKNANRDYIRQAAKVSESYSVQPMTEELRTQRTDRQSEEEKLLKFVENKVAVRRENQPAIDAAKANPDKLVPQSQKIAEQNKALLGGSIDNLLGFAQTKYGIKIGRGGEVNPGIADKLKSIWSGTKAPKGDALFDSIRAELQNRQQNFIKATEQPQPAKAKGFFGKLFGGK